MFAQIFIGIWFFVQGSFHLFGVMILPSEPLKKVPPQKRNAYLKMVGFHKIVFSLVVCIMAWVEKHQIVTSVVFLYVYSMIVVVFIVIALLINKKAFNRWIFIDK